MLFNLFGVKSNFFGINPSIQNTMLVVATVDASRISKVDWSGQIPLVKVLLAVLHYIGNKLINLK